MAGKGKRPINGVDWKIYYKGFYWGLKEALKETGAEKCEFGPCEGGICLSCEKDRAQLYFLRTSGDTEEGEYLCAECVVSLHLSAKEYD